MHTDESATNKLIFRNCCRTCGLAKTPEDFYADRGPASGHQASCKDCLKKRAADWQRAHPDRHRTHVSAWKASHREDVKRLDALTRSRRDLEAGDFARLASRVATITRRALKAGVLVRPDTCTDCGRDGALMDAVHADYDRPLEVLWLCRRCHHRLNLARQQRSEDDS